MPELTCIRVGYGKVAAIHQKQLEMLGVKTLGIIELDINKQKQAEKLGFTVVQSYTEAAKLNPFFWDICVDTNQHLSVLEEIINVMPNTNILVEKPICYYSQINQLQKLINKKHIQITINENYASSSITKKIKEIITKLKLQTQEITIEFTKNRIIDILEGRFIDHEIGVLGYEGSHMIDIVFQILPHQIITEILSVKKYPSDYLNNNSYDSIYIKAKLYKNIDINLYTSISGKIKYQYPIFAQNHIPLDKRENKYRCVCVDGQDEDNNQYSILGFFEPITGLERCQGAIIVIKNGKILEKQIPLVDNSMKNHMELAINYFQGSGDNPYSIEQAIKVVEILYKLAHRV